MSNADKIVDPKNTIDDYLKFTAIP